MDIVAAGQAVVSARKSALAIAERGLDDTVVRAPHEELVLGLNGSSGEMVASAESMMS